MKKIITILLFFMSFTFLSADEGILGVRDAWEDYRLGVLIGIGFTPYSLLEEYESFDGEGMREVDDIGFSKYLLVNYSKRFSSWFSLGLESGFIYNSSSDSTYGNSGINEIGVPIRGIAILNSRSLYLDLFGGIRYSFISVNNASEFYGAFEYGVKFAYDSYFTDFSIVRPFSGIGVVPKANGFAMGFCIGLVLK